MNKLTKIVFINFAIILFLLCITEFIFYKIAAKELDNFVIKYNDNLSALKYKINIPLEYDVLDTFIKYNHRIPVGLQYKKKPLVLFGCSFTFGSGLKNDTQLVSYKLSECTKRPVYNRGLPGKGIQHMYYQLNSKELYNDIKTEPEYMFYFFSYDLHSSRLIMYTFQEFEDNLYLRYKYNKLDSNGDLIVQKPFLPKYLNGLFLVRYLTKMNTNRILDDENKVKFLEDYCYFILHQSKKKALEHWPNVKFVIYYLDTYDNESLDHKELLERLKNDGWIVVTQKDLSDISLRDPKYYISEEDSHPNENYWNEIAPKLANKLNL